MTISTYEPLYTLKKVDDNIWIVDGDIIKMTVLRINVPFPTHMTIIKLSARRCYNKMLSWNPDKIFLAHGRWYDKDGVPELKRAFKWLDKK